MADTTTTPTTPAPPESALGKQLAEEARVAAFRKTIAESKEAEAKAEKQVIDNQKAAGDNQRSDLKGPEVKALDGKVTATGSFIETKLLANKLLSGLIKGLVEDMFTDERFKADDCFVIYNAASIPLMEMCYSLTFQLNVFDGELDGVITAATGLLSPAVADRSEDGGGGPLLIGLAASGLLRTTADIISLFRTDTTITNTDLAKDENLLTACFAEALIKGKKGKLFYPGTFPVNLFSSCDVSPSMISLYTKVKTKSSQAAFLQQQLDAKVAEIDNKILSESDASKISAMQQERQPFSKGSAQIAGTNTAFAQVETMLLSVDQTSKASLLSLLVHAEKLKELLSAATTYTVKLDADLSGSSIVKQNLFTRTQLTHTGGARLSCIIFANDGSVKFAYNEVEYSEEMESAAIKKLVNVKKTSAKH